MAFSEFYTDFTNGSNLNAGSTNAAPVYTSAAGDSDGTSVFTPNDGVNPSLTVSAGMFASVYVTAGATVAVFVGRVVTVVNAVNGAITVSTTAKSGTFPAASAGAHTITCIVGGYWKGPNAAAGFPFGFITNALTDVAGDLPRVNFTNGAVYSITAAASHTNAGPITFSGMTASPGDGGKFIIDGGTSGVSYTLLTLNASSLILQDCILRNNGASATAAGLSLGSALAYRVVVHDVRGSGFSNSGAYEVVECEAYACNQSNTASLGGFLLGSTGSFALRCYAHDNVGNNNNGFCINVAGCFLTDCIADTNGKSGFVYICNNSQIQAFVNCDAYNNTGDGFLLTAGGANRALVYVENCNAVKNGGYGINFIGGGAGIYNAIVNNCGFGSGTQVNTSGQINSTVAANVQVSGSVTYPSGVTPWNAPTTGDFRIILPQAEYAGRGNFTQTDGTNTGTVAYPDIGAGQHSLASAGAAILFA